MKSKTETEMSREEAIADVLKRLEIMKVDSWAMDEIAGELMEQRAEIQTEIGPKLAAIQNIEYRLVDLTNRKTGLLVQYRMAVKVLNGLETAKDAQESMEVV